MPPLLLLLLRWTARSVAVECWSARDSAAGAT
jgi:hypothetical protein